MPEGTNCSACNQPIGFWPMFFRSPLMLLCPHCHARSCYDQAIYVFLPVALTSIGLLVAVYKERLGFIAFMVILSSLNALMIIYFRKQGKLKLMRL